MKCTFQRTAEPQNGEPMLAASYSRHGKPRKVVRVQPVPRPGSPADGELLVRVRSASLNPADWKSGQGEQAALLKFAWPRVYGFDFSGEVVAVGKDNIGDFNVGDNVFGMIRGLPQANRGTMAEYALVDADVCAKCPTGVSHQECASIPLVAITAVKMLRACGLVEQQSRSMTSGPRVLITGGAGGVGSIAIQLAIQMFGASFVATTASAGAKAELCTQLGASKVVNYRTEQFWESLGSSDDSQLFDAVLDCTGEASRCVELLRKGGGLCSILAGPTQEALTTWIAEAKLDPKTVTFGVNRFLHSECGGGAFQAVSGARSLRLACEARGATFAHVIGTGNGEIMNKVAALMASGSVRAVIDKEFPLFKALEAIEYQATGRAAGKVVVNIEQVWETNE